MAGSDACSLESPMVCVGVMGGGGDFNELLVNDRHRGEAT